MKRALRRIWKLMKLSVGAWALAAALVAPVATSFASPLAAQDKQAPAPAPNGEKKESAPAAAAQQQGPKPLTEAGAVNPQPVPAEIREALEDRALLLREIERIETASGDAVKIPAPLTALRQRAEMKLARFTAWLDQNKIPREWQRAGWKLDDWQFTPPAPKAAPAAPPAPAPAEKKPEQPQ